MLTLRCKWGTGRSKQTEFVVTDEEAHALLSGRTVMQLGALTIGLHIQSVTAGDNKDILSEFQPLFTGVGKLQNGQVKPSIDPEVKPVAQPIRRTSFGRWFA